jgi:CheY-like chemotaxis protein/HPt (histidine-containing phosphotransfer) domain-containing protein
VLEALHRQRYDVILMDVQMPELDGLDATRQIRSEFPAQHQPYIIAMTANVTQGDDDRCLEAGMNDYLGKPIRLDALAQALARGGTHVGSARTGGIQAREARTGGNAVGTRAAPAGVSSPSGATLEEVLDPAAWSRLRLMLGVQAGEMLPMLIDTLLEEAAQLHQDACWAVEENRPDDLRRTAHTLKSNAANFGAMALAATCLELENVGRKDTVDGATDLLVRLEKEFEQVKSALQVMREHKEYS